MAASSLGDVPCISGRDGLQCLPPAAGVDRRQGAVILRASPIEMNGSRQAGRPSIQRAAKEFDDAGSKTTALARAPSLAPLPRDALPPSMHPVPLLGARE